MCLRPPLPAPLSAAFYPTPRPGGANAPAPNPVFPVLRHSGQSGTAAVRLPPGRKRTQSLTDWHRPCPRERLQPHQPHPDDAAGRYPPADKAHPGHGLLQHRRHAGHPARPHQLDTHPHPHGRVRLVHRRHVSAPRRIILFRRPRGPARRKTRHRIPARSHLGHRRVHDPVAPALPLAPALKRHPPRRHRRHLLRHPLRHLVTHPLAPRPSRRPHPRRPRAHPRSLSRPRPTRHPLALHRYRPRCQLLSHLPPLLPTLSAQHPPPRPPMDPSHHQSRRHW